MIEVNIIKSINDLLLEEDTDDDKKITIDDFHIKNTKNGDKSFLLELENNNSYQIKGTYYLANLLQELTLKKQLGLKIAKISTKKVLENPVDRTSRLIKKFYWKGLTRSVDEKHLSKILYDDKLKKSTISYLYVPEKDSFAFNYFSDIAKKNLKLNLRVIKLSRNITPKNVKKLEEKHGLLSLMLDKAPSGEVRGVPFVVPGGRFNEMYGWDSYFEALGLIIDGEIELAKSMVDNFVYEINNYGKILNANRTYYLTRSQPPFLTSMALAVYNKLPKNEESKQWLKKVLNASISEYYNVWLNKDHLTSTGLSRYYGTGIGISPEVESGHFDPILKPFAKKFGLSVIEFEDQYKQGLIKDADLDLFFVHDRAVRESGHDTTYRWRITGKDRCANFVTVDLNSLLYKYELDISFIFENVFFNKEEAKIWFSRSKKRKKLILKYLWNKKKNMFFDYDFVNKKQSDYISATTFYPLWAFSQANQKTKILNDNQAKKLIHQALIHLESNGGVFCTAKVSVEKYGVRNSQRQWDYPNGWAPHQMLIWRGLNNYGYKTIADRLIYKWLYTIIKNVVDYNGTIPEKFDVLQRSHAVFAEYGNVGTKFSYMTKEGFGWMNASYQVGLKMLSKALRKKLESLIPPEQINFQKY
ncbi:MAG: trehalase [Bacteroidetes bacterium]|nr:trehalase [Bacteroidota bacterium]